MRWQKLIPQAAVVVWCGLVWKHRQQKYSAVHEGLAVVVYTCRCGKVQNGHVAAANRGIRRAEARRTHLQRQRQRRRRS